MLELLTPGGDGWADSKRKRERERERRRGSSEIGKLGLNSYRRKREREKITRKRQR